MEAHEQTVTSTALRQQLGDALGCYVALLRGEGTPRDLAVGLVGDMTEPAVDATHVQRGGFQVPGSRLRPV